MTVNKGQQSHDNLQQSRKLTTFVMADMPKIGMVIGLEGCEDDLHMVELMPQPPIISCFIKIQNGLPFWCRLTQIVLEKRPLNGCGSSILDFGTRLRKVPLYLDFGDIKNSL